MAFAVHINMERCTGCNNCVVACPVGVPICTLYKSGIQYSGRSLRLTGPEACAMRILSEPVPPVVFEIWNFEFIWILVFGAWIFRFIRRLHGPYPGA